MFLAAALLSVPALHGTAYPGIIRPVTDKDGKPPRTALIEETQEALRLWGQDGRERTLIYIGSEIGVRRPARETLDLALELLKEGRWDEALAKGYSTPKKHPVDQSDFLYVAHAAGMVDQVYFVPPTKESVGKEPLDTFSAFLKEEGVGDAELAHLSRTERSIEGRLNGVPFHIYSLKEMPPIKGEVSLLIDLSFFLPLYQNEVKTPLLDLMAGFMETLGSLGVHVSDAAVSYSGKTVPLEYRFIGGYLHAYLTEPGKFASGPPKAWELRSKAMYSRGFFQTEDEIESYAAAVKLDPHDASLKYALAMAFLAEKNMDAVKDLLPEAARFDMGYYPALVQMARKFHGQGMDADAEAFLIQAQGINPYDPAVYAALHELYFAAGKYGLAERSIEEQLKLGFRSPSLLAALADTYLKGGDPEKAARNFKEALALTPEIDRRSRGRLFKYLAEAYAQDRKIKEAIATYRKAFDLLEDDAEKKEILEKAAALKKKWAPYLRD